MTRSRYRVLEQEHPHFLTCTVVNWLPIFTRPEAVQVVLDSWRFMQEHGRLVVYGYVVMENHLHLVASSEDLAKEIGKFKSFTARQIIDGLMTKHDERMLRLLHDARLAHRQDRDYQLWQEGSHPQAILHEEMMRQKLEYIHLNPVKRGYVDEAVHWRYSSARNYAGMKGLLPVRTEW